MKNKLFAVLTAVCIMDLTASAQKPVNTDYDYSNKKVIFPAIIRNLTREDKYAIELPRQLSYYGRQEEIQAEIWNPFTSIIEITARLHQVKYDYKFEIVAGGLLDIRGQAVRYIRTELPDATNVQREVRGFVRDFTCHFPCTLVIKNAGDTVLQTIEIAGKDEVFTVAMHKDFLLADNKPYYPKKENPYFSEKELMDAEAMYRDVLAKKIEQIVAYKVFHRASLAITHLFKDYNTYKQTYGWGFVKARNRPADYADLDQAVLQFKSALDSLEKGNFESCRKICEALGNTYTTMLQTNEAKTDNNLRQVLYYNLSHVNLLSGRFKEAWEYYRQFIQTGASEQSRMAMELKDRINLFEFHDKIKASIKAG